MIKDKQVYLNRLHVVLDAIVLILSYLAAYLIQFVLLNRPVMPLGFWGYMKVLLIFIPGYLFLYVCFQLYTPKRVSGRRVEASNIFKANLVAVVGLIVGLYLVKYNHFSRFFLFYFGLINTGAMVFERNAIRLALRTIRRKGLNQKHVLLVGYSHAAEGYVERIKRNSQWGYQIEGMLDDNKTPHTDCLGIPIIGPLNKLQEILAANQMDEVIITLPLDQYEKLNCVVNCCEKSGVHTKFIPDYNTIIPTRPYTEDLLGLPVVNIRHVPLQQMPNRIMKRAMDIVGALVAITLFSPVMLLTALLIKLSSPGPLIYKQERVGLHNRPFMMYKFRSMRVQNAEEEKKGWTTKGDPRVTGIGRFIRKTSIDELPQLFNVLMGSMSLVGPRPERPQFVEKFKEEIPRYMIKHQVRPGMTGWAQVNGLRGDTSIMKRIEYDLYYIENWTIGLDFKIIILTFVKGFVNTNAY